MLEKFKRHFSFVLIFKVVQIFVWLMLIPATLQNYDKYAVIEDLKLLSNILLLMILTVISEDICVNNK